MSIKVSNTVVVDNTKNLTNINSATFIGTSAITIPTGTTGERPTGTPGMIRYNSTDGSFEGYTTDWGAIGGDGGGYSNVRVISANTTANIGEMYVLTTNCVLTLSSTPAIDDVVGIFNMSGYGNSVIFRNTLKIVGLSENLSITAANVGFDLVYTGTTKGWIVL